MKIMNFFSWPIGTQLSITGWVILLIAILFLIISQNSRIETVIFFTNERFSASPRDSEQRFFTLREKAKAVIDIEIKCEAGIANVFLTDIYPPDQKVLDQADIGPKYFHLKKVGKFSESHILREGQYQIVFWLNDYAYSGEFSLKVEYDTFPYKNLEIWGVVFSELGIAILVTGVALLQ